MSERYVSCPKCCTKIPLSEAFTHEIEEELKSRYDAEVHRKEEEWKEAFESKSRELDEKLKEERLKFEAQVRKSVEESYSVELKDLRDQLNQRSKQLESVRQQELDLRKRQRELEDREQNLRLETARTLDAERKKIWDEAAGRAAEEQRLRVAEKDKQLADAHRQVEELRRKLELSSQQMQGEVQEVELETILRQQFPIDAVEPVAKGMRGADIIQKVHDDTGHFCGSIIWESKRTKSWGSEWIQKLKDDQRTAGAEIAVIVTSVLPKDVAHFGLFDGVWVCDFSSAMGLAAALRFNIVQVAYARNATIGKSDKMELIYKYLSGPQFTHRIEAIVESFKMMKKDLDDERTAMERIWAKREKQINRVLHSTAGLRGDLEGIIGSALPEVKILELPSNEDA